MFPEAKPEFTFSFTVVVNFFVYDHWKNITVIYFLLFLLVLLFRIDSWLSGEEHSGR
jgi:hypothetical protein